MTYINRSQFIKDSTFCIHNLLSGNITDPQRTNRTTGEQFVMASWPNRPVRYPVITVQQTGFESSFAGVASNTTINRIDFEVNVWSKSIAEKESLTGSVFAVLAQNPSITTASGLMDLKFFNITNLDEDGPSGIHRKLIGIRFLWPEA